MVENMLEDKHKRRFIMEHRFTLLQFVAEKKPQLPTLFFKVKVVLDQWNQNLETRKQLRELTDDQLKDIGLDRMTALREAQKPFWQD